MRQSLKKQKHLSDKLKPISRIFATVLIGAVFALGMLPKPTVQAATLNQLKAQAQSLQAQIDANNAKVLAYKQQAATLQGKLNQLASEIAGVNAQIELTNVKLAELQVDLEKAQNELERQKQLLKASMQALYKKGGASTLELLISSDSFSQFINDQEYLERLKGAIQDSANRVIELKQQIQNEQTQQQNLLAQQKGERDTLSAKQAEQKALLDYTKGQESLYQSAVNSLKAQQAEINRQLFAGARLVTGGACDTAHGDTYPSKWCGAPQDSVLDSWGMWNRECVSYTAWKVYESGRHMPYWGGQGNANEWDDDARADGIPVDTHPRAGDVAISNAGYYGHAMYVESVNSDGTINISQYNASLDGRFSRVYGKNPDGLVFIHFP